MQSLINSDELFTAIQNFESDGIASEEALLNMIFVMDKQAKAILSKNGYGIYEQYITGDDEVDQQEWINEAFQLLDYSLPYPISECAMIIIEAETARQEVENLRDKFVLAMSITKLITLSLLPNEVKNYSLLTKYKSAEQGRVKGRSKGGRTTADDRRADANEFTKQIQEAERQLALAGKPKPNRASILAERFGVTAKTIRNHLKKELIDEK